MSTSTSRPDWPARKRDSAPAPFARRRAARSLTTGRGTCGMRAAGVPLRGENGKDVQVGQPALVDDAHRVGEHLLRLGREAGDEIGAEHDVGAQRGARRRRTGSRRRGCGGASCASGPCRRRPASRDAGAASAAPPRRWRAGGGRRPRPDRWRTGASRSSSGTSFRIWRTSAPSVVAPGQVAAVGGDVDAGEHDLAAAALDEAADLRRRPRPPAPSATGRGRTG